MPAFFSWGAGEEGRLSVTREKYLQSLAVLPPAQPFSFFRICSIIGLSEMDAR